MIVLSLLLKYLFEGIAVAIAAYVLPKRKLGMEAIILVALTAVAMFSLLDVFTPLIGTGARRGAGFGIGYKQFHLGLTGMEGFDGSAQADPESQGTCAQAGTSCTYASTSTPLQQSKYVCRTANGICAPIYACKDSNGTCSIRDEASGLVDTAGKTCITEQIPAKSVCRLTTSGQAGAGAIAGGRGKGRKKEGFVSTSSLDTLAGLEGFEGFAKVF